MKSFCLKCGKEAELKKILRAETYPVKGENTEVQATVCLCEECDSEIWNSEVDDENLDKAYRIYRKKHNLLQPEEIKTIREKYGLSQVAFAKILGFGEKTITRYENGSIQDEAPNNLIRLMSNPESFMEIFNLNKFKLTDGERKNVEIRRFSFTMPIIVKCCNTIQKLSPPAYSYTGVCKDVLKFEVKEGSI